MLQTLDVLIGFTLVMLVMSMAVTMVTQFLGTWLLNLKGVALRAGLARLLANLDRGFSIDDAFRVVDHILRDPLVGQPKLIGASHKLGTVVHRDELVKLILDFASNGDAAKVSNQMNFATATAAAIKAELQHRLRASLDRNGIKDPGTVLDAVRMATLDLEKASPELSTSMRTAAAILTHGASQFLAKLNNWFDQTIDRVSEVFTARIRIVTFLVSLAVALFFQLNAFQLINRLSVDDELRKQMVGIAIERVKQGPPPSDAGATTPVKPGGSAPTTEAAALNAAEAKPATKDGTERAPVTANTAAAKAPPEPQNGTKAPPAADKCVAKSDGAANLQAAVKDCVAPLEQLGLIAFPKSGDEWVAAWGVGYTAWLLQLIGILLSTALLSLGAPFWYAQLANLVRLRSVVSGKDDHERAERQTTQPVAPPAPSLGRPRRANR
ncbi:MAG: hypothetical protein ACJ8E3_06300 [Sphingomicrobium sp.]